MCGIAGIVHGAGKEQASGELLARMTAALAHRGPDDFGYVALTPGRPRPEPAGKEVPAGPARVFLGHRRLSIIDLAGTRQPLRNEDGTVWVVFNGEIYNYRELAEDLGKRGHQLRDKGDTEVLVHLWEEHAEAMVDRLVGMFAFAIYDARHDLLFLARDRFGKKPLYYWERGGDFLFASELQAFFGAPGFAQLATDQVALAQYFRYGYVPNPRTAYVGVRALPPGRFLVRKDGRAQVHRYWRPRVTGERPVADLSELRDQLDRAVRLRLTSDVPFGAFLSGGIDSALVVAAMSRLLPKPVQTFTIGSGHPWFDETAAARLTAQHLQTDHHEFKVEPDLAAVSEQLARHFGQPFADHSAVPTYYVSRESRHHVTVALSGDGGDELFAGYGSYRNYRWYQMLGFLPLSCRRLLAGAAGLLPGRDPRRSLPDGILAAFSLPDKGENHSHLFHHAWREAAFAPEFARSLAEAHTEELDCFSAYYREAVGDHPIDRWLEADQCLYLCDDLMSKVDIAAMAVSLECRAPFLDHRLAEFANRLSWRAKLQGGGTKAPLRDLAAAQLPPAIARLPKKGFSVPLGDWLRGGLKPWAHNAIFADTAAWTPFLRTDVVHQLWQEHQAGRADHAGRLWAVAAVGMWRRAVSSKGTP